MWEDGGGDPASYPMVREDGGGGPASCLISRFSAGGISQCAASIAPAMYIMESSMKTRV